MTAATAIRLSDVARPDPVTGPVIGDGMSGMTLALLRHSKDCVLLLSREGRIGFVNRAGRETLPVPPLDNVSGLVWADLWPAGSRAIVAAGVVRALAGYPTRLEAVGRDPCGAERVWEISITPVAGPGAEVESLIAIAREAGPPAAPD